MKSRTIAIIGAFLVFIIAFLFLVPVVSYSMPAGVYMEPPSYVKYGSITYWALGAGGTWNYIGHGAGGYTQGYSVSVVTATASASSTSSTSYTVSVQPTRTATTTTNPTNDLELRLFLNTSSSSATGISVGILVDAYNPSSSTANVTSADNYAVPLNYSEGAYCGDDTYAQNPTVGFAITEGYYTSSNVTQAKLLNLVSPNATYICPLYLGYANPTGFLFQPLSDMAISYGCIGQSRCMSGSASTSTTVTGYWNHGGAFISFPKGTYTVLAEDEWGNLDVAYFTVS